MLMYPAGPSCSCQGSSAVVPLQPKPRLQFLELISSGTKGRNARCRSYRGYALAIHHCHVMHPAPGLCLVFLCHPYCPPHMFDDPSSYLDVKQRLTSAELFESY